VWKNINFFTGHIQLLFFLAVQQVDVAETFQNTLVLSTYEYMCIHMNKEYLKKL